MLSITGFERVGPAGAVVGSLLGFDHWTVLLLEREPSEPGELLGDLGLGLGGREATELHRSDVVVAVRRVDRREQMGADHRHAVLSAGAGRAHAGMVAKAAGGVPPHLGPRVDGLPVVAVHEIEELGWGDVARGTSDEEGVALLADLGVRVDHAAVSEQSVVEEVDVTEVEQVVDHQPVVDIEDHPVALAHDARSALVEVREVRDEGRVRGLFADPHPDQRVPGLHGVRRDVEGGRDAPGAVGVRHARARRVVPQAVVRALDVFAAEPTLAQRGEPMRALIDDGRRRSVEASIEHERLLADRASRERVGREVVGPHRDVPRVSQVLHRASVHTLITEARGDRPSLANGRFLARSAPGGARAREPVTRGGSSRPSGGRCRSRRG